MKQILLPVHVKLVGNPRESSWAQSFIYKDDLPVEKQVGTLFGVLALEVLPEQEATIKGQEILSLLVEKFRQESTLNRLQKLKEIVQELHAQKDVQKLEICLGLFYENAVYFVKTGSTKIFLQRNGHLQMLLPQDTVEAEIKSASGYILENDLLILETGQFETILPQDQLAQNLNGHPLEEISDILAPQIVGAEDSSKTAAVIIKIEKKEIPDEDEEIQPVILEQIREEKPPEIKEVLSKGENRSLDNIYQNIFSHFPKRSSMGLFKRRDFKSRKNLLLASLILFLVLAGTIILSIKNNENKKRLAQFNNTISTVSAKLNEGKSLADLNPNKAKTILSEANNSLQNLSEKYKEGSFEDKKITSLRVEIAQYLKVSQKIYQVKPTLFFELAVIKEKAQGKRMASFANNLLILDTQNSTVYLFKPENKQAEIVAGGPDLKGISLLSFYGPNAYCFLPGKGIIKADIENITKEKSISLDKNWGQISDLTAFGGNLYLLDSQKSKIWKYIATDNGFSNISNYLTTDTTPDLSSAQSIAIDGFVYVLLDSGEILKFAQGRIDNFNLTGLDPSFIKGSRLFTTDEAKYLYILDPGHKRIVLLNKDGNYFSQYEGEKIGESVDFAVIEPLKKIFLLTPTQIYSIELK